jgi:glucosyl-dolichyl phosphate glucuronosyltransferase
MNITVILCTCNRCKPLATALESVAASELPSVNWEVLVVDNNSQDQTREVVQDFSRRYPGRFRYVFEPKPGKSFALNSGIRESHGEVLAFMDDDVTVERTWLRNLTAALDGEKWGGAGGRIVLQWPASLPNWLSTSGPYARHPFPGFDQGQEAGKLIGPPFGTNMAFRKEMFEKYGTFRLDLGPSPDADIPRPGEDTEFGRRLIVAREPLRYEPSAVVYHPVPESRINKNYFLQWWFDYGRADVRVFQTRPLRAICSLAAWTLRWMVAFRPRVRFFCKLIVWEKAGAVVQLQRELFDSKVRRMGTRGSEEGPAHRPRPRPRTFENSANKELRVR